MFQGKDYVPVDVSASSGFDGKDDWPTFLTDGHKAQELLRECRWLDGECCPRCRSRDVKRTNSFIYRELLRCSRCNYSFNVTSMTIFHGSKMPLHKHLQLLVAIDFYAGRLTAREIGDLVDLSERTVKLHLEKYPAVRQNMSYIETSHEPGLGRGPNTLVETLISLGAVLNVPRFRERLKGWLFI